MLTRSLDGFHTDQGRETIPGIGELKVLIFRRGAGDMPHTHPTVTDTENWRPTLPINDSTHPRPIQNLKPTHMIK